jgi:hypothetical protein
VEQSESIDTILLRDIQAIFERLSIDRLPSQKMCDHLAAIEDRPWGEWSKGRPITTNRLAGRLKMFGVHSKQLRQTDGSNLKGYALDSFKDAFNRYIAVQSATTLQANGSNGFSDIQSATSSISVALQNAKKVNDSNGCSVVAFQNDTAANSETGRQSVAGSLRI